MSKSEVSVEKENEEDLVNEVLKAKNRIKNHVVRTPTVKDYYISTKVKADVHLKLEPYQVTGVFKVRGAFNGLLSTYDLVRARGVVCASAGNHGMAVAYGASRLGLDATIVLPRSANPDKVQMIRQYGAQILEGGDSSDEILGTASRISKEHGSLYLPDDVPIVMAGQGTIGLEFMEDCPDIDTMIIPVGGGGLIAGVASIVRALSNTCKIIGVQSERVPGAYESFRQGKIVTVADQKTIADGLAVQTIGEVPLKFLQRSVDDILLVSDEEMKSSIKTLLFQSHIMVEPSAAAPAAALLFGKYKPKNGERVGLLITGGNISYRLLHEILSDAFDP